MPHFIPVSTASSVLLNDSAHCFLRVQSAQLCIGGIVPWIPFSQLSSSAASSQTEQTLSASPHFICNANHFKIRIVWYHQQTHVKTEFSGKVVLNGHLSKAVCSISVSFPIYGEVTVYKWQLSGQSNKSQFGQQCYLSPSQVPWLTWKWVGEPDSLCNVQTVNNWLQMVNREWDFIKSPNHLLWPAN